jgi:uncharacterized membrane-anchored protein YjiN (DUF445 family)
MTELAAASDVSPADVVRARGLARMRTIATGLLGLMAVVFVAASLLQRQWPAFAYVRAFGEAGMVGACADWFAVTALFRRPFGLPIPHTGIIPRNKARIGEALGGFIADNFLTERVLEEKLRQLEVARWGGDWLRRPENARRLAERLAAAAPKLLRSLPPGAVGDLLGSAALAVARATPAGPAASKVLAALWSEGRAQPLFERALDWLGDYLASHEEAIRTQVSEHSYSWLPKWVDRMLADKLTRGLVEMLGEMRDPQHPWRRDLAAWVEDYIARLGADPDLQARADAYKLRLLSDPNLRGQVAEVWSGLETRVGTDLTQNPSDLAGPFERAILALGNWLAEDQQAQAQLNARARQLVSGVIAPRRHEIGLFVAQVVASWDARSVVDKLELQVGRDLQYIRINGTLVGGLVGVIIFAAAKALGLD